MLECPNCHKPFDALTCVPRILISCGHTFCHQCINALFIGDDEVGDEFCSPVREAKATNFECPECGAVNSATNGIESFPKNLVLLQLKQQ